MGDRFVRQYSTDIWHSYFGMSSRSVTMSFSRSPLRARQKTLPDTSSSSIPYPTYPNNTVTSVPAKQRCLASRFPLLTHR